MDSDDEYDEYYQRRKKVIIFAATETQRIIGHTDRTCRNMIRMSRKAFFNLCQVMRAKGLLYDTINVQVEEQVVIFLYAIGHNFKNRVLLHLFGHKGETISRYFNHVLGAVLKLYPVLLKPSSTVTHERIAGSASDSRILDDTIHREGEAKLPVPREWRNSNVSPANNKELFNLRHSRLRNIIERVFGPLKSRFKILKSQSEYPFKTQARIVQACVMIHNHILTQNSVQEEEEWLEQENVVTGENTNEEAEDNDENSDEDSDVDDEDDNFDQDQFREEMVDYMWNNWMAGDDSDEEMHDSSYESQEDTN
ncbi:uncharacterized protein LOC122065513 [Macadamia integrifolia]|uniref:uncharacterized protein LOC122065513 n=1 Tax=Macadamia integrifolia TaxID=60698 RepID=UPI001C4E7BD2|nr:uncharacterized protein LOC122065513 [Macadamia integrifolia]